jgi:mono/diheme cytochrome c family protein
LTSLLGATGPLLRSSLNDDPAYRLNIRKFCVAVAMILQSRFLLSMAVLFTVLIASPLVAPSEEQSKQKWSAPAAEAQKKNPVAASESSLAAGRKTYSKTCAMCHGKTGDADGPAVIELNIHPAKLSDPKIATESDGSLFWKITTGKKPMPTYGKRLSETDRWNLVNYVRTLSKR